MKFLADMGIAPSVVDRLNTLGHDAVHASTAAGPKTPDTQLLELARQENRVILTTDLDFSELLAVGRHRAPSVISFRQDRRTPDAIMGHLQPIIAERSKDLGLGAVISVEDSRYRVRRLPIPHPE